MNEQNSVYIFVTVNKIVHIRMGATERVHLGARWFWLFSQWL